MYLSTEQHAKGRRLLSPGTTVTHIALATQRSCGEVVQLSPWLIPVAQLAN